MSHYDEIQSLTEPEKQQEMVASIVEKVQPLNYSKQNTKKGCIQTTDIENLVNTILKMELEVNQISEDDLSACFEKQDKNMCKQLINQIIVENYT